MKKLLIFLLIFLVVMALWDHVSLAIECELPLPSTEADLKAFQEICRQRSEEARSKGDTLKAAITALDAKIRLTSAQIKQTTIQIEKLEEEIAAFETVVVDLGQSLDQLAAVYAARVRESYIRRDPSPVILFLSSDSFAKFFTRARYLSIVKSRDQQILSEIEKARTDYENQRDLKITKQKEVETLKAKLLQEQADLSSQQKSKQDLLITTQNDEQRYQSLLAQARSELEAINAIISGGGQEIFVRDINQGEVIAKLIDGWSCNSTGTHLHFIVADNSVVDNPFKYLKPVEIINYSGDAFKPTGSWEWPLSSPIQLNQGYGETECVKHGICGKIYPSHNGIDIVSSSLDIKAVQPGRLYRGTYAGIDGCTLKYVRVDHKDSAIETYYLHVNYN